MDLSRVKFNISNPSKVIGYPDHIQIREELIDLGDGSYQLRVNYEKGRDGFGKYKVLFKLNKDHFNVRATDPKLEIGSDEYDYYIDLNIRPNTAPDFITFIVEPKDTAGGNRINPIKELVVQDTNDVPQLLLKINEASNYHAYLSESNGDPKTYTYTLTNQKMPKAKLLVTKLDEDTRKPLPGAKFKISGRSGEFETDENGQLEISDLIPGNYYLEETQAPPDYKLPRQPYASFKVGDQGDIKKLYPARTGDKSITINQVGDGVNSGWSPAVTLSQELNYLPQDEAYEFRLYYERKAKSWKGEAPLLEAAIDIEKFDILGQGKVEGNNPPLHINLKEGKKISEPLSPLASEEKSYNNYFFIKIKPKAGINLGGLQAASVKYGNYTLVNNVNDKPVITFSDQGQALEKNGEGSYLYTITNRFLYKNNSLTIRKENEDGEPIEGVFFKLEGQGLVQNTSSDSKGEVFFDKLLPGHYMLTETKWPDDYEISPNSPWALDIADGSATIKPKGSDQPVDLTKNLGNIWKIVNPVQVIGGVNSNGSSHKDTLRLREELVDLGGGRYQLQVHYEKGAYPYDGGHTINFEFDTSPRSGKFDLNFYDKSLEMVTPGRKYKATIGGPASSGTFFFELFRRENVGGGPLKPLRSIDVRDDSNKVVNRIVFNANEHAAVESHRSNDYEYTITNPYKTVQDPAIISFVINKKGQEGDKTGPLEGAKFRIAQEDREVETDGQGRAAFSGLKVGTYTLYESHVPDGYEKNQGPWELDLSLESATLRSYTWQAPTWARINTDKGTEDERALYDIWESLEPIITEDGQASYELKVNYKSYQPSLVSEYDFELTINTRDFEISKYGNGGGLKWQQV